MDVEAARRICDSLRSGGVDVWFDADGGLEHGDEWDAKIRRQIKECVLFIPVISASTQAREEGYFRLEWDLAAERARTIASGVPFILPIVIDDTREPDALAALNQELASVRGAASGLDCLAREIAQLRPADLRESALRGAVEKLARALQAAALVKKAPDFVAEAFVAARIDHPALTYGATAASFDDRAVLERACLTN